MKFGFIPSEGQHLFVESLQEVELGEKLGFDSVWIEEHHGVGAHYWPSPLIILAGCATRTSRLTLGSNIAVVPFYNPVRLAEDSALLDVMSGGRFTLGVAIGYRPDEFGMMSAPMEKRGSRFAEAVTLIRRLWTEDQVSFQGEYFQYQGIHLEPRPLSKAGPALWIGGWGALALKRAAALGDAWIPGPTADLEKLAACQAAYHTHLRTLGKDPSTRPRPLTRELVISERDAEAWDFAEKHLQPVYRDEYGGTWKHPLIGQDSVSRRGRFSDLGRNRFIVGDARACIEQIHVYREALGVDHIIFRLYFPGVAHEFIEAELKLLADEVLPACR